MKKPTLRLGPQGRHSGLAKKIIGIVLAPQQKLVGNLFGPVPPTLGDVYEAMGAKTMRQKASVRANLSYLVSVKRLKRVKGAFYLTARERKKWVVI